MPDEKTQEQILDSLIEADIQPDAKDDVAEDLKELGFVKSEGEATEEVVEPDTEEDSLSMEQLKGIEGLSETSAGLIGKLPKEARAEIAAILTEATGKAATTSVAIEESKKWTEDIYEGWLKQMDTLKGILTKNGKLSPEDANKAVENMTKVAMAGAEKSYNAIAIARVQAYGSSVQQFVERTLDTNFEKWAKKHPDATRMMLEVVVKHDPKDHKRILDTVFRPYLADIGRKEKASGGKPAKGVSKSSGKEAMNFSALEEAFAHAGAKEKGFSTKE